MKNILFLILALFCLSCSDKQQHSTDSLPRSTPEKEGVDSEGIVHFLEAIKDNKHELHSFMFMRHGKVIAEGWASPFSDSLNHALYSVTKTFTSTAVGFAVSENLLSVDDKVISFFPESLPDTISPYLEKLSVKHLLSMSVGQDPEPTFSLADTNCVRTFLAVPIVHEPGSKFHYNSYASYMLSAIVQKVSGQKLYDYLQPRLFEPLAIKNVDWMEDASGINTGGWGLSVKTEDLAKLGQLYLQKGEWNGKQLLPESWIEEATSMKIEQAPQKAKEEKTGNDWEQGYCYQIWRSTHGYRADGAYGQYIVVLPEENMVVALTSHVSNMQEILTLLWKHLIPAVQDTPLPLNAENQEKIKELTTALAIVPNGWTESPMEKTITGKIYEFPPNEFKAISTKIRFEKDTCIVNLKSEWEDQVLNLGKGFWSTSGSCFWEDDHTLIIKMMDLQGGGANDFIFKFDDDKISISSNGQTVTGKIS
ncbi:MAG: beta-lactamase family protein [Tannerella sp.]|jgi:CubicO group peptidase (beta-lactamase class C family)|nr:beta-lactamase family protein [Tannerella sp.]